MKPDQANWPHPTSWLVTRRDLVFRCRVGPKLVDPSQRESVQFFWEGNHADSVHRDDGLCLKYNCFVVHVNSLLWKNVYS